MEPLNTYLTKKGWSDDLEKTIERYPYLFAIFLKKVIGRHSSLVGILFISLKSILLE
jgi:hypothetical protein